MNLKEIHESAKGEDGRYGKKALSYECGVILVPELPLHIHVVIKGNIYVGPSPGGKSCHEAQQHKTHIPTEKWT